MSLRRASAHGKESLGLLSNDDDVLQPSLFFLDAADACAQALVARFSSLDAHHTRIVKEIVKIGPAAGVPNAA